MIVARTISETRTALRSVPRPLGFLPTMGALHPGHLSLAKAAKMRCASVAASVFVNPTQFRADEDFAKYPRHEARDLQLLEAAGADVVFAPAAGEMYPEGFATSVRVGGTLAESFEGAQRPGHFDGMALVVTKLLDIVAPDLLFLGEKDAQQLAVVHRFVRDLDLPVEVVGVPTVREQDGLAMSSRNAYLTAGERSVAPDLYRALLLGRAAAGEPGATPDDVTAAVTSALSSPVRTQDDDARGTAPAAPQLAVDYVAVVDADTFETPPALGPRSILIAAAHLGSTRLIDNLALDPGAYHIKDATQ